MKNSQAIANLITAAEATEDALDELACRRAAVWLRWCDGFGATLTRSEVERIAVPGALGEAARGLIRRLVEEYPGPVEDIQLACLHEDDGAPWSVEAIVDRAREARSGSGANARIARSGQSSRTAPEFPHR
ncbi:hypothetical protein [Nioella ostreopsis]|uniref:hypothetical protein n=1 Tax=Nioella ostreopsis TaxID=2448479 RepID=UPI000FD8FBF4|nr:hypothetical protein [Nioella ostreopsis]